MNLFSGLKGQAMQKEIETITIPKAEYDALIDCQIWSDALEAAGVDNWEGYDEARAIYQQLKEEYETTTNF